MKVYLVSRPEIDWDGFDEFCRDEKVHWSPEPAHSGETLCELAGRICYMSYGKGRKTNKEFLDNIISSGHHSVLEHANFTVFITGVSRSCTHELVRHRHLSYSQLSQRYVDESLVEMIMPNAISEANQTDVFCRTVEAAKTAYRVLVSNLELLYKDMPDATLRRKAARQAARAVLPNATETKIAVTGNARAWRQFIQLRATVHADPEIRALAMEIQRVLRTAAPKLFADLLSQEDAA